MLGYRLKRDSDASLLKIGTNIRYSIYTLEDLKWDASHFKSFKVLTDKSSIGVPIEIFIGLNEIQ